MNLRLLMFKNKSYKWWTNHSKLEFFAKSFSYNFFTAILKNTDSGYSFTAFITLNMNLSVLLPTSNIGRHLYIYLLLKIRIHLFLYRIRIPFLNQSTSELQATHAIEIFMWSTIAPYHSELLVEYVLSVSSFHHSIINDKLL